MAHHRRHHGDREWLVGPSRPAKAAGFTPPPRRRARLGTVRHLLGIVGLLLVVAAIGLEGWICLTMALAHNGQRLGDHAAGYIMGAAVLELSAPSCQPTSSSYGVPTANS